MARDARLSSKNNQTDEIVSDSSLTCTHIDWEGGQRDCAKASRLLLTFELIMVMTFILQSAPLSLTLYGPDLPHCPLAESLLIQRTREGPYALCLHATHLLQRQETRTDVPWLKPAPHRETVSVSCQCSNIRVDPSISILQIHDGYLTGLKWRKGNVSAGKSHQAKVSRRSTPGKVLNYTEDGLNSHYFLCGFMTKSLFISFKKAKAKFVSPLCLCTEAIF